MLTPQRVALQLYTVRSETANDFVGTLAKVAAIGYEAVELAGYGQLTAQEVRAALDANGLKAVSAHVGLGVFDASPAAAIAELQTIGCEYAVVPMLPADSRDAARLAEVAALLNLAGGEAKQAGIVFAYHNHDFEYEPMAGGRDGQTIFDFLIANTDPDLVAFELDAFWTRVAGVDPVTELARLAGRVPLLHLKDYTGETSAESAAPVGEGQLVWGEIIAAANAAGVDWGIVEQDFPEDPLRDAAIGFTNAQRLLAPVI